MTNKLLSDMTNEDMDRLRDDFMTDTTPVATSDIPYLVRIAEMLRTEDTDFNVYELYKHPDTRAKLFAQITKVCFMMITKDVPIRPSQEQKLVFSEYLEDQFQKVVKKVITSTDKHALGELLDVLELPKDTEKQFIRDIAVSGVLAKD